MLQFPPSTHFRRPPPPSKPEIPGSVPGGPRPHRPCQTSICPLVLAIETLPAAGFELQCSIPSASPSHRQSPCPTPRPAASSDPLAGVPGPRRRPTPRSLCRLRWLSVRATRCNSCSTAPAASCPGPRPREKEYFQVPGVGAPPASLAASPHGAPGWRRGDLGPSLPSGLGYLCGRGSRPLLSTGTPTPPVPGSGQVPRVPSSSYRSLHVRESGCISCGSRIRPALPEVCVGNGSRSFCWQRVDSPQSPIRDRAWEVGHQPGPSLTRQPRGPTSALFPLKHHRCVAHF